MGKDKQEFPQYVFHCIYYFFGNRIFSTIYLQVVQHLNSNFGALSFTTHCFIL